MLKNRKLQNRPKFPHWRSIKKRMLFLVDELKIKGYFEDCNCAPCKVENLDLSRPTRMGIFSWGVDGQDLLKNKGSSCSLTHCGIKALTKEEAFERRDYWLQHGEVAYQHKFIYPDLSLEQVQANHDEFVKNWR